MNTIAVNKVLNDQKKGEILDKLSKTGSSEKSFKEVINSTLANLDMGWKNTQDQTQKVMNSVPESSRPLLQAQMLVSNCNLKIELVTKLADGVQQTFKKLQQQS